MASTGLDPKGDAEKWRKESLKELFQEARHI